MRPWWRRNGWALVAIAVLVPGGALAVSAHETGELTGQRDAIVADADGRVALDGAVIGPARAEFTPHDAAPSGTRVVTVTIPVNRHGTPLRCLPPVLQEATGKGREWAEASAQLGTAFSSDRLTSCTSDLERFALTLDYVVPDDASGPFVVDVVWADALPRFARLTVSP